MNIVSVMKAMGAESDQEVVAMVGCEEALANLLLPSVQECKTLGVFTQHQALEYLGSKLAQKGFRAGQDRRRKSKVREGLRVFAIGGSGAVIEGKNRGLGWGQGAVSMSGEGLWRL